MAWWEKILDKIKVGNRLQTPGRGLMSYRSMPFVIIEINDSEMTIISGSSRILLEKICFVAVEEAFRENPLLWLRAASLHETDPLENSVDGLVRTATGSKLARGNYISSILVHCGLVKYSMQGNRKGIQLPRDGDLGN